MTHQLPFRVWIQRQRLARILRFCSKNGLIDQAVQVHGFVLNSGFGFDVMLNNDLVGVYCKCGEAGIACKVFDRMPERNVVSWTALMCGLVQGGYPGESLSLFAEMGRSDISPNEYTFSVNLKACGLLDALQEGMQIHGMCLKTGFEMKPEVGNSLVDMYSKCGRINEAAKMFASMADKNLITWNTMIAGFIHAGCGERALLTFQSMQKEMNKENPDEFTLTGLLKACSSTRMIHGGRQIHGFLVTSGFPCSINATIVGSLIDLYVKCGNLFEARRVFDRIKEKTVVSWSSLILGYAQQGNLAEAMNLFRQLRETNSQVDDFVLSSLISVFADFALMQQGRQIHALAVKIPSGLETSVSNSIMDMYLKCGLIDDAERCFDQMESRDVVSWTVMITGYGKHGLGKEAISLFNKMLRHNIKPDEVSYLAVLSACSHSGLIKEGQEFFSNLVETPRIKPRVEHYACMVDLLGRAGSLREAKHLIDTMPVKPNVGIWQTLLSACRLHGDVRLGKEVGEILMKMDANNPANYVMISNIFAQAGYWDQRRRVRELVKRKRLRKEAGMSWVEVNREVHFFYGGDNAHPLIDRIHETLKQLEGRMKQELGYVYGVQCALYDVEDESREENLRAHSEKLAIGLALVVDGLNEKKMIRVFKNLRVCVDCHEFIKGLSKILNRVFVVRDACRFHRFADGHCSCGDYW